MDRTKENPANHKPKRKMISLSKVGYDRIKELNKVDINEMGRHVTLAETVERRVM